MKTAATGWVRGGFCLDQLLSVHAHVSLSAFFRYLLASLLDAIEVNSQVQFVKIPEGIEIVSGPCIVVAKCHLIIGSLEFIYSQAVTRSLAALPMQLACLKLQASFTIWPLFSFNPSMC